MDLVTGGTGFVGWHVTRKLAEQGERVRALVRPGTPIEPLAEISGVEVLRGDLCDRESLIKSVDGCRRVFHVGALYTFWLRDPRVMYQTNVDGTVNLMQAAKTAGVERIVYTSTVGALGIRPEGETADEETPVSLSDMVGHYKRSKFLAEEQVRKLAADGLPVVIVNPSAPVGSADRKPTPTGQMIVDFMEGRMKAFLDTGLNLVDVEDVAAGHLLAAEKGRLGERYILGNKNLTLQEIFHILAEITGRPAPRHQIPYAIAWTAGVTSTALARLTGRPPSIPLESVRMARKKMFFNPTKAVSELGLPQGSVEAALEKAVRWFEAESNH